MSTEIGHPSTSPATSEPLSSIRTDDADAQLASTAPGQYKVIKRNGKIVPFESGNISVAITKAFLAVEGGTAADSKRIHDTVDQLTDSICSNLKRRLSGGGTIHIEDIQDQVELALMRSGEHKVARSYVLYREERSKARELEDAKKTESTEKSASSLYITDANGHRTPLEEKHLKTLLSHACEGLDNVSADLIFSETMRTLYDGIPQTELSNALIITTRTFIEKEPAYTYVAARLLLSKLQEEALGFLGVEHKYAEFQELLKLYPKAFEAFIKQGVELKLLDAKLLDFNLKKLGKALEGQRDMQFGYLGLQTLYDRYFIHHDDTRFELPQVFFMRVAMGLAYNEKDREKRAIEFYNILSRFDFMSSTPTLFNSGTLRPQLSSCYLSTVPDCLDGIYHAIKDNALLSKYAGGLGNDWTPVRALGAHIKGTNGKSQGVVPFLKVANDTAVAVNQGGKRKGALCSYLESWHLDIEEFLELRKNTGDDRRRTHDMNTANWVPDLFMKRVMEEKDWTLFSPDEVSDLHDKFGLEFEEAYLAYEAKARAGELKTFKTIPALSLWRKMLSMLFETGHPWITFKDPCNLRSPQQHTGVVHSSNLCTEITLNTNTDEIAVCNLGSINLPAHLNDDGQLDTKKLENTVNTAMRMLDNVIDINYYSVPQSRRSNLRHRPVGLGVMGFQDALHKLRIPYSSEAAVSFADETMEHISYFAISASTALAEERGSYSTYEGSLWSKGILPIDSIETLADSRGQYLDQDTSSRLDWESLRERVKTAGMRNSNTMAIAPTATIANICGISQSIEPTYQNLFVKSNLSGEFTVVNTYLVDELKKLGLWDDVMVNDLKYFDGSLQKIDRVPAELRELFKTAFEIEPRWLVEAASRRQKWLDQAQSLNLYMAEPSGKKMDVLYKMCWLRGLKTTYYLRSLGATSTEKSTSQRSQLNAVSVEAQAPKACSIDDPDCEACQ